MTPSQPDPDVPADPNRTPPSPDSSDPDRTLDRALDLVRFLRANCEWDAAQTPHSLLPYLLEEAHETADAVAAGEDAELRGELGDLLLNVAFQIVLAEERAAFNAAEVVRTLEEKMQRRHPHLYGGGERRDWEALKREERGSDRGSILDGIASGLEPLSRAHRIQERVAEVGFDWPSADGALAKVHEEIEEVAALLGKTGSDELEEEIGDLLFAVVNLARLSGVHPMRALVRANAKFTQRFARVEALAAERGLVLGSATLEELDGLWGEIKETERR